ncbi:MAG: hypothetical protein AAF282_12800 [Cyanobacteria bacterium P01_A01_bin.15]
MKGFRWLTDSFDYIFEAAVRIFSPSDDAYPVIGMQPYEGDVYSSGWI